jgi:thiamine pyrophosphokinase
MHVLILTGGFLNLEFAKEYCKTLSFDKVFAVDKGLEYADALGVVPDWMIGDFDTVDNGVLNRYQKKVEMGELKSQIEAFPPKKDATDTELALMKAVEEQATEVTLLAATGTRVDHVLANMNLLLQAERAGIRCYMVDETNRIQLLSHETRKSCEILKKEQFGVYLSVIPMSCEVKGLTLSGVEYPLNKALIKQSTSLTVSNVIQDEVAHISLEEGRIWLIESRDNT